MRLSPATVTIVDIDSSKQEELAASSPGSATGLNLKEKQKIYFGGLPTLGNYRYTHTFYFTNRGLLVFNQVGTSISGHFKNT